MGLLRDTSGVSGFFTASLSIAGAPFSVSITPSVYGESSTNPITTDFAEISIAGGVGPFSYLWTFVGDPGVTILNPTSSITAFRASTIVGEPRTGIAFCQVTDTFTGASVNSDACDVMIVRV